MRSRWLCAAAAIAPGLVASAHALAAVPPPPPSSARLQGFFELDGQITKAVNVPGELSGQPVRRVWALHPLCPTGACPTVELIRQRRSGRDALILHRHAPAFYVGTSQFYAPVRCQGIRYRKGELVSFRVTVRVTAAALEGTTVQATRLRAFYTSLSRVGLTRCFSVPSRDAARYLGALLGQPAAGSIRSEASTRLTAAS
jgi:hypothetical protein